jgi:hypothetical protein
MSISCGILAHIRHAERWLRRARADYQRGDARQAELRLLLAEAEIRRARESGAAATVVPRRRPLPPAWVILGTVAATGVILAVYALTRPPVLGPAATDSGAALAVPATQRLGGGILRFESGQVLPLVGLPGGGRPTGRTGAVEVDGYPLLNGADGPTLVTFR